MRQHNIIISNTFQMAKIPLAHIAADPRLTPAIMCKFS